ncbi:MAG: hypothetical protein ABEN55_21130 [Bradymonadaceae bacterium]
MQYPDDYIRILEATCTESPIVFLEDDHWDEVVERLTEWYSGEYIKNSPTGNFIDDLQLIRKREVICRSCGRPDVSAEQTSHRYYLIQGACEDGSISSSEIADTIEDDPDYRYFCDTCGIDVELFVLKVEDV